MTCKICGKAVSPTEIALYKRMINRGATDAMCLPCLAAYFCCDEALLHRKIEQFRRSGCTLFPPLPDSEP